MSSRTNTNPSVAEPLDAAGLGASLVRALQSRVTERSELPFTSIHSVRPRADDVDQALAGEFRLGDERFALGSPIDWSHEAYRSGDGRGFFQNSFVFADPLLQDERYPEVLEILVRVFADWIAAHPLNGEPPHKYAWYDHAVAGRLVYMSFVLREVVRRGLSEAPLLETIGGSVLEHAGFLVDEGNHAGAHNHGLFSDAALAITARNLSAADQAATWESLATARFARVLGNTVALDEGVHLEHSPAYHAIVQSALERFSKAGLFPSLDLDQIIDRMARAGEWFIVPDGTLVALGDTSENMRAPESAVASADQLNGMRTFSGAGYVAVRSGTSYLIVTCAHHPTGHKHADDGSFCLYESGRAVVTDSANPGYDYGGAERQFGTSPRAHSTVSVDGFDWFAEGAPPYGSGILATSDDGPPYAMLVRNPVATARGGPATRLLLYVPGEVLVVIDDVAADPDELLARYVQVAPGLSAAVLPTGGVHLTDGDTHVAWLVPFTVNGAPPEATSVDQGRRAAPMIGFVFPTTAQAIPRCTVSLTGAAGPVRGLVVALGELAPQPTMLAEVTRDGMTVRLGGLGYTDTCISVRQGRVAVTEEDPKQRSSVLHGN